MKHPGADSELEQGVRAWETAACSHRAPSCPIQQCACSTSESGISIGSRAIQVPTLLQQLNHDRGNAIVMVTDEPKVAEYARHALTLDKGTLFESAEAA